MFNLLAKLYTKLLGFGGTSGEIETALDLNKFAGEVTFSYILTLLLVLKLKFEPPENDLSNF